MGIPSFSLSTMVCFTVPWRHGRIEPPFDSQCAQMGSLIEAHNFYRVCECLNGWVGLLADQGSPVVRGKAQPEPRHSKRGRVKEWICVIGSLYNLDVLFKLALSVSNEVTPCQRTRRSPGVRCLGYQHYQADALITVLACQYPSRTGAR
eukprot:sb/3473604/